MKTPPKKLTIELSDKEVKKNLSKILEEMQQIRHESFASLETSTEQSENYLKLTGELASCVNALITSNKLEESVEELINSVKKKNAQRFYDTLQNEFWNETNPDFKEDLYKTAIKLLGSNFTNESQVYHVFQALKYLKLDDNRLETARTITPVNSLLGKEAIQDYNVIKFVLKNLGGIKLTGLGMEDICINDVEKLTKASKKLGLLYLDLQNEAWDFSEEEKKKFIFVKKGEETFARIQQTEEESDQQENYFKKFKEYARKNLGNTEENLAVRVSNVHSFGQRFAEEFDKLVMPKRKKSLDLDWTLEKTERCAKFNDWVSQYKEKKIQMASLADYYSLFKQIKKDYENDKEAQEFLKTFRGTFKNCLITTSTVISFDKFSDYQSIIHNYGSFDKDLEEHLQASAFDMRNSNWYEISKFSRPRDRNFIKRLFGTKDDLETIMDVLAFATGIDKNKLTINNVGSEHYPSRESSPVMFWFANDRLNFHYGSSINRTDIKGASYFVVPKKKEELKDLLCSKIDQENNCVHYTNTQKINDYYKHTGLFCFKNTRYIISVVSKEEKISTERLAKILAKEEQSDKKISEIGKKTTSIHAHLIKYQMNENKYKLIDDIEVFQK
ncbi:hypothetical protein HZA97_08085 [Candidatus Woesearchaeota archaeon]|nr:hypothetical protein [Candidatus Woesearchaeota archaeon]